MTPKRYTSEFHQKEAFCEVTIIDDSLYEPEEEFTVVLSQPTCRRFDKEMNETKDMILKDPADIPVVTFNMKKIEVEEELGQVEFEIRRSGSDLTGESSVIVAMMMQLKHKCCPLIY